MIRLTKVIRFLQDRDPRKPSLIDLKHETLKEQVVISERESVLRIVIGFVEGVFGMRIAVITVGGHNVISINRQATRLTVNR
jgi:hypothetical protein